jgi:hypothetical protein
MVRKSVVLGSSAAVAALVTALSASAVAAVPASLTQQGRLLDTGSQPVAGTVSFTFAIYAGASGGAALWTETQSLTLDSGYFSAKLGEVTAIPGTLFDGSVLYLGVTVGADAEMAPREKLVSVPYAILANNAVGAITPASVTIGSTKVIDETGHWVGPVTGLAGTPGPTGPAGAQGPQGATGAGAQGPQGAPGNTGPQGAQGNTGPQGAPGNTGPQGAQGSTGAQGAPGNNGSPGAQGPQGAQGNTGAQGAPGAQGPQGYTGAQGAQGNTGAQGPAGPQGPQGTPGAQGAQGPMGPQGPSGLSNCLWYTSATSSLGGPVGSTAVVYYSCPAGRGIMAGGCDGYTSVAIGRSEPYGAGWQCFWNRTMGIGNANDLAAQALCCL